MALELLKAAAKTLDAAEQGDGGGEEGAEPRETAAALLARFRSAQDDTAFRVRQREIKEQEARDAVAAAAARLVFPHTEPQAGPQLQVATHHDLFIRRFLGRIGEFQDETWVFVYSTFCGFRI